MKDAFIEVNFQAKSLDLLDGCNLIIDQFQALGLRLTLRQLYYQLVTRNIISNLDRSYKNLGKLLSQGRLAGVVDWDAIEDRLRQAQMTPEWDDPESIMQAVVNSYATRRWESQANYVELWVEKDALAGVLSPITNDLHVVLMVNRGYSSQSAMKDSADRLIAADELGKAITILYIGDQDPSGEDMVRDVTERLDQLTRAVPMEVIKLAITEAQVAQYAPPPNPTKMSDSRAAGFVAKFGTASYEADALPPDVLAALAREAIEGKLDMSVWEESIESEERDKELLRQASEWVMGNR